MLLLREMHGELFIDVMKREIVEEINDKFPNNYIPKQLTVSLNTKTLPVGKVAKYSKGVLLVHPKALGDRDYLRWVLTHELIHASFKEDCCGGESHHWGFQKMAEDLGLPEKYRD